MNNSTCLYDIAPQYDKMLAEMITMTKDTTLTIRLNKEIKSQAAKVAAGMGIDLATAINMFLVQIIKTDRLPFVPTGESELDQSLNDENAGRVSKPFNNASSLLDGALRDKSK
ncbi:type II toxin-antitoxin system RelB/DinJ family antitoxin [Lentilactobacillus kisonensis]|nr:type II toxin-antitoxin system RelB/DinJ family antitoxin [Lentilactobacillus kisonensis]